MPRAPRALLPLLVALVASRPAQGAPAARPACPSRYADALAALDASARERESRPAADWLFCLRASAVYEHVSYGRGGKLAHSYVTKVRHGTGFAYKRRGQEWLVATNQHVVSFPDVTVGEEVEGVPQGSRRVRTEVRIVANEQEVDGPDQIVRRPVLEDEALDVAVLASAEPLHLAPYRFGRSADLRVGNAVLVRGYPLGAFLATNAGRVIGVGQRDVERGWDHEDFAVDALLNLGSSGSPVLAVGCESGEPEIVGIYHAGYRNAQGLNVVVAIDGLRTVLDDLRPTVRVEAPPEPPPDPAEARAAVARGPLLMPFGRRAVRVEPRGQGVVFSVLDPSFPLSARVELSIVDRGTAAAGRAAELRLALWQQLGLVLRYRALEQGGRPRPSSDARAALAGRIRRGESDQEQLLAAVQAGADGFGRVTRSERDPASRGAGEGAERGARSPPELVLGAR
jgi:S1-C subfamily serine protease